MAFKFFKPFRLAAVSVSVALVALLFQSPTFLLSQTTPPSIAPRSCNLPAISVQPRQVPPDPDWTNGENIKRVWHRSDPTKPNESNVTEQWVTSVAFSPDGRSLVSGSRYRQSANQQNGLLDMGVPWGKQGVNGGVEIWRNLDVSPWNRTVLYTSEREINAVAFNPAGMPLLAAGGNDKGIVGLWRQSQWKKDLSKPYDRDNSQFQVNAIAFSPNGRLLASSGIPGKGKHAVQRWDVRQGKLSSRSSMQRVSSSPSSELREDQEAYAIAFSPDSKIIAGGGFSSLFKQEGTVSKLVKSEPFLHLWEAQSGKYLCTISNSESAAISAVAFSPDGTLLATGNILGAIHLWSLPDAKLLTTFKHPSRVNAIAFSPSGKLLLSGSTDRTVRLWEIPTGKPVQTLKYNDEVTSVAFRPDGQAFVTGNKDSRIQLISLSQ